MWRDYDLYPSSTYESIGRSEVSSIPECNHEKESKKREKRVYLFLFFLIIFGAA
ncbi:unnamed protein product, partial [Cylicocyclus nassatus]